ncbi:unnamed protein product [Thlaspi arvense]|uniref:Exportin-1/Importin-beta-like domain-containing protein n=1 Tax=Thlaspi arvense TaxID=13288 RepID=A0AAU9RGA6_THLAR|nr:unnamed protein product [Thlaspi arvense]
MQLHLVRLRWDELNPMERRNFANASVDLMSQIANPCEEWALKSQMAALVAELLERHFGAAVSEASKQQLDVAKQHAATVTATLNAINAYAEWAPVADLSKYGIVHGCGFLLSSPDFRLHACEFFKLVSPRKRPADDTAGFDSAMSNIFQILMNACRDFLLDLARMLVLLMKVKLDGLIYFDLLAGVGGMRKLNCCYGVVRNMA